MNHHPDCDVNDVNPDGIRKPCNCAGKGTLTDPRTNEELNRIIHTWMGWQWLPHVEYSLVGPAQKVPAGFRWVKGTVSQRRCVDYTNDLNAMAEAEGKMDDGEYSFFMAMLMRQVLREGATPATYPRRLHSRNARQRAEALVQVIEEEK